VVRSQTCAALAVVLAASAATLLANYRAESVQCTADVCTSRIETLLEAHGRVFWLVLLAPAAIALFGLLGSCWHGALALAVLTLASVSLAAFSVVAVASIGAHYLPAALMLLLAVILRGFSVPVTGRQA
jgi:hypothetical protein